MKAPRIPVYLVLIALLLPILLTSCGMEITPKVTQISLSESGFTMEQGAAKQLLAVSHPDGAPLTELKWKSTNESIATVDENGTVTAMAEGVTMITAAVSDEVSASCFVTVEKDYMSFVLYGESCELIKAPQDAKQVVFPDSYNGRSVRSLKKSLFSENRVLQRISLPKELPTIPENCFYHCAELVNVSLPIGLKKIEDDAFRGCFKMKTIQFPDGLTYIGKNAFTDCSGLQSVRLPNSVTDLGDHAFNYCKDLKELVLSENLVSIPEGAFSYCDLSTVTVPKGVSEICRNAFTNCTRLQWVILPARIISIEDMAFQNCFDLTTVYFEGTEERWKNLKDKVKLDDSKLSVYFYSEEKPEYLGRHWHYVNGAPTLW